MLRVIPPTGVRREDFIEKTQKAKQEKQFDLLYLKQLRNLGKPS